MKDLRLLHDMDACRPGSDDLELPELRELKARLETDAECRRAFGQIQRLDSELRDQLAAVPVPHQLRQRVLSSLAVPMATPDLASPPPRGRWGRTGRTPRYPVRTLVTVAAGLAAMAACLLLAVWALTAPSTEALDPQQLAGWAVDRWQVDPAGWQSYDPARSTSVYPVSRYVQTAPTRWQRLSTELDRRTVVFELPAAEASQIRLFVLRFAQRLPQLPTRPPEQPLVGSRGWRTAAWQELPHLYVLTIEGSTQDYFEVIRATRPALAGRRPLLERGLAIGRSPSVVWLAQSTQPFRG